MRAGFRKVCAALCSTALLCAATAVPASASTVSDVIAAAYAVGIPAQYVQEGIAMYGGGNYTSEQCDQAIASIYSYQGRVDELLEDYFGVPSNGGNNNNASDNNSGSNNSNSSNNNNSGSNSGGNSGLSGNNSNSSSNSNSSNNANSGNNGGTSGDSDGSKSFTDMTLDEKIDYVNQLPAEERSNYISNLTTEERNSFIKQLLGPILCGSISGAPLLPLALESSSYLPVSVCGTGTSEIHTAFLAIFHPRLRY